MLTGVFPALLTPFTSTGNIDESSLKDMIHFYNDKNIDGLFVSSSVGECAHLSFEEKIQLLQIVSDANVCNLKLLAGVTDTCSENALKLAKIAADLNYDAIVSAPPYFYKPSEDAIFSYFQDLAENSPLPVIIYHVPLFTPSISTNLFARLISLKNIIAIKDSTGSLVELMHNLDLVKKIQPSVSILVGREEMYYASLLLGASGCIVASAGIVPETMVKIKELTEKKEFEKALKLQESILPLLRLCFSVVFPCGFKVALSHRGFGDFFVKRKLSPLEEINLQNAIPEIKKEVSNIVYITNKI